MSDSLSYIDSYFSGELPKPEKAVFEEKCSSDPVFAEEVAFYISARDGVKKELYDQKKSEFAEQYTRLSSHSVTTKPIFRKIVPYASAAAACLILFLGWKMFFTNPSAQRLADQYIENNLQVLSKTMGGTDSVQLGLTSYNEKQYSRSEEIFKALLPNESFSLEAIEYLGVIYLTTGRYDEALIQFGKLSGIELQANRGPFYTAVTLMKRSAKGDREKAKQLLKEVSDKDLPGSSEAKKWLEDM